MARAGGDAPRTAPVPPLPAEDFSCGPCDVAYAALPVDEARRVVAGVPQAVREAVASIPEHRLRARPAADGWSVVEYACHLRDVYVTYTIRLHRARTEDRPVLEPMLNDLRARRFGYRAWDLRCVLGELDATVAGFLEEAARVTGAQWDRTVVRLPGEERTARWLVRQAMHEGVHHVADIRRLGASG